MLAVLGLTVFQYDWLSWRWQDVLRDMSWPAQLAVLVLFVMAVRTVHVMLDRTVDYAMARAGSRRYVRDVSALLAQGNIEAAILAAKNEYRSHIATIVRSGLERFHTRPAFLTDSELVESAERLSRRRAAAVRAQLATGVNAIATIAATAPFVGLFATTIGIINAFRGCEGQRSMCMAMTVHGIAEALVTTALALMVAVTAVWVHNYLHSRMEIFEVEMDNARLELVSYLGAYCSLRNREQ